MSEALTVKEAALRLGRSYRTVLRWIDKGYLKAFRLGGEYRIKTAEVERLLNGEDAA